MSNENLVTLVIEFQSKYKLKNHVSHIVIILNTLHVDSDKARLS